jgi:NAD-dependent deacetylase
MKTVNDYRSTLHAAASDLARAKRVLVITGAGISADSGLPVYRGCGGLYDDGLMDEGIRIEDALSGAMLRRRPEVTWKHLLQIARAGHACKPNAAHLALAQMEANTARFTQFTVLTQNVDSLHVQAGTQNLIEIHGDLRDLHCSVCGYETAMPDPHSLDGPPICPCCAATLRPSIVLFGEALPPKAIARYEQVLEDGVDFVMVVGTTAGFPYIAGPVAQAARAGLPTLEINPARSEVSYLVRHHLPLRAAEALPALWECLDFRRTSAPMPAF